MTSASYASVVRIVRPRGQPGQPKQTSSFDPHQRPIQILGDTAILSPQVPIHPMLQRPVCGMQMRMFGPSAAKYRYVVKPTARRAVNEVGNAVNDTKNS
jgi:hypothetical protein